MIHLIDAAKSYETRDGFKTVLQRTTLSLPVHERIGILGRNGQGKSTLLRMLAGVEPPDSGDIIRTVPVSWPLGFSGAFHPDLTGRENIRFVSRIYDVDSLEVIDYVEEFSELGPYLDMPLWTYSAGMRARITFATSLAISFDCYLVDEILSVGDQWFKQKAEAEFNRQAADAGMILVSHNINTIRQYCNMAVVLINGRLLPFDDMDDAVSVYNSC